MSEPYDRSYFFIRHGRPINDANSFRISGFQRDMRGEVDEGLSEQGQQEAASAARYLHTQRLDYIGSSTLKRAMETASIISAQANIPLAEPRAELEEITPGKAGRRSVPLALRPLLSRRLPRSVRLRAGAITYGWLSTEYLIRWRLGRTQTSESFSDALRRVRGFLRHLDSRPEKRVAWVGHGYWIFLLAGVLTGPGWQKWLSLGWVPNCSVTQIDANGSGGYRLASFAHKP